VFGAVGAGHALYSGDGALMSVGAAIFGCAGTVLSKDEARFFAAANPLGFILFARNLETPAQISALTADLRASVGRDAIIMIDQEGGRVARLRPPQWLEWLPALEQMARTRVGQGARAMWIRYRLIADELRHLGIDTNCAPIADVPGATTHSIIKDRCYGGDADTVAKAARAVAEGLLAGGVLPVLKHIPGHGRPNADSHLELPLTEASAAELRAVDFAPFAALSDLPLGMTAHVVYAAFDPLRCATLSPRMIGLIRDEIGFDGLLMTDDLSMAALKGPLARRAREAISAGCDVVLHCNGDLAEMTAVAAAAGRLGPRAVARAARAMARRVPGPEIERDSLLAELSERLMVSGDGQNTPS